MANHNSGLDNPISLNLYIHGAGGHGKVVFHTFASMGKTVTAFLDDNTNRQLCGLPVLSPVGEQNRYPCTIHCAIGNNSIRQRLQTAWREQGILAETAIHARAVVYPDASIGSGSLLAAGSVVGPNSSIGEGCILNHQAVLEHDTAIGDFCHIAQTAVISGGVRLGNQCLVGAGAVILPYLTIGSHVSIAAGTVVTRNLPNNTHFPDAPCDRHHR